MSLRKTALIPMMLASMACVQSASAQTTGPTEEAPGSPCQVTPGEQPDSGSLTDTLDKCNGVLKPPAAGDPDMVEQAPDVGETPVIPPAELPEQQDRDSDGNGEAAPEGAASYSAGHIVDAIGAAGTMADRLQTGEAQPIEVRDISILFDGIDAAVINASLAVHADEIERLREAVRNDSRLSEVLAERGLAPAGVVAAETDASGTLVIFAR
ncbi:MAG: hypothetical protein KKB66_02945 [Alphaproteobacteria bacterium]|nr:hypothetical protein [Alphaproteobacteria bacterium]MBU0802219.1 hypothetical protein [Alphaproteobacteria bacterium]MBU0870339.1 hypothetical protein [Alphaproteobacteria bacterium]MBU1399718.1 hypothetical protein [Alphaproteobacteria bacterium]MBU1590104.1 hypothetical protein [Alphaproteobacteria bacterium]